ncbi:MAG TPA: protein kinase, partial [Thermoanaerobaculia bacterium]|nr:protein kinase [Thermoanaerobaculia bacterium]
GAMGIVYLGRDPVIGRMVALKTIRVAAEDDAELREFNERFMREAQAAGILSHPNIVTVHDVGEDSETKTSFIAMEFVEGKNLKQLLQEKTAFSFERVAEIIGQVAEALDYAHRRGIVHRDVKPANIIITGEGAVKITDFGIAKIEKSNLTSTGQFLGTPNYMSPEQVTGEVVDGRSDLFSLGVVLYELLTRKKPFSGENLTSISYKIVHETFTPPETYDAGVPPEFSPILTKVLAKDPAGRFQNGREFALALYEFKAREEERQLLRDLGNMVAEAEKIGGVKEVDLPRQSYKTSAASPALDFAEIGKSPAVPVTPPPPPGEVPLIEASAPDWELEGSSGSVPVRATPAAPVAPAGATASVDESLPGSDFPQPPPPPPPAPIPPPPTRDGLTERIDFADVAAFRAPKSSELTERIELPPLAPPAPTPPPVSPTPAPRAQAPTPPATPRPVSAPATPRPAPPAAAPVPPAPKPAAPAFDSGAVENRPTEILMNAAELARAGAPGAPKSAATTPRPGSSPVTPAPAVRDEAPADVTPVAAPRASSPTSPPPKAALKREVNTKYVLAIIGGAVVVGAIVVGALLARRGPGNSADAVDENVARETTERRQLMDDGNRLLRENKAAEALAKFREVVRRAPDSQSAREAVQKAEVLAAQQAEEQKKTAEKAKEIETHIAAARDAAAQGNDVKAKTEVDAALALDAENADAKALAQEIAAREEARAAEAAAKKGADAKKKAKPTPTPKPAAKPVAPVVPVEAPKAPTPTPSLANLRISFQSPISKGLLMVGVGEKIALRKDFDFGKGSSGGPVEGSIGVPAGRLELKVWLISPDRSVNVYQVFAFTVPGGETKSLVLALDASRKLTAAMR